jgi:hypothetical protein
MSVPASLAKFAVAEVLLFVEFKGTIAWLRILSWRSLDDVRIPGRAIARYGADTRFAAFGFAGLIQEKLFLMGGCEFL